jgi:hypothetical protein
MKKNSSPEASSVSFELYGQKRGINEMNPVVAELKMRFLNEPPEDH